VVREGADPVYARCNIVMALDLSPETSPQ